MALVHGAPSAPSRRDNVAREIPLFTFVACVGLTALRSQRVGQANTNSISISIFASFVMSQDPDFQNLLAGLSVDPRGDQTPSASGAGRGGGVLPERLVLLFLRMKVRTCPKSRVKCILSMTLFNRA